MAKYIGILSGKGGVGKTTTAINLGSALNYFDKDVTVVDGNLTTPNVGLHLGVPVVPINLHHALRGENHITEAVYLHPAGMKIVPAGISMDDLKSTNPDRMPHILGHLNHTTDFVIIDGAAGLGREALATICSSEFIIIVTNPELPAIADALKTVKYCEELGRHVIGVVLTRTRPNNLDVSLKNIETILDKPVIGIIPEDNSVREAMVRKDAVVYTHPKSSASVGYKHLAAAILGRKYESEIVEENWIMKVLNRLGLVKI
ncbi:MAG: cell division ATPase MinD [Nanoarchaeota archaeon]|nr:cell division ATPase MinD [Nanoarchaeota archaeon]